MAWGISDKEDADTLQDLWSAVHKRCPPVTISTVMTDDGRQSVMCVLLNHAGLTQRGKLGQFASLLGSTSL